MNSLLSLAADRVRAAWQGWDRFWFTPRDARSLSLLRVLSGAMLLYTHFVWGLAFQEFFGPDGWQDPLLVQTRHQGSAAWSFWWIVPPEWAVAVHWGSLLVLALYTIGLATRLTSILALVITISYVHRVPMASFGLDQINALTCLYLCLAPCGAYYSVDRLIARRFGPRQPATGRLRPLQDTVPTAAANVATRLLQVHLAILYLSAGLAKLKGETWWTGDAIWLCAANLEYQSGSLVWLAWHPRIVNILTLATVAWELSFVFLIWNRTLRPLMLLVGTGVHLGIGLFLGMWTFGLAMIFAYLAFVPPEFFQWLGKRWSSPSGRHPVGNVAEDEDELPSVGPRRSLPAEARVVSTAAPVEVP